MLIILYTYYSILILYTLIVIIIPIIGFIGKIRSNEKNSTSDLKISIIVPFRNEASKLTTLCESINYLKYPKDQFEVLFVDDNSSDNSLPILELIDKSIDYNLIQNAHHLGKKASIQNAVAEAKYDYIFTTDADCKLPSEILHQLSLDSDLSIGVTLKTTNTWGIIENMQEVESLMLAGITLGSANLDIPMLSSGANLGYKRVLLKDTNPYADNMNINSGDDMFLLKAAQKNGYKVSSRGGTPVITHTESTWQSYIDQSVRWAGKNDQVKLIQASIASWLVLITNLILPLSLITHFSTGLIILVIKFVVDFLFLFLSATYYDRYKAILFAPVVFVVYPIHLVMVVVKIINKRKKG